MEKQTQSEIQEAGQDWRLQPLSDREKLLLTVIGTLVLVIGGLFWFGEGTGIFITGERLGYVTNVFTEGISIFLTVVALGFWHNQRERENLKQQLLRKARSRSQAVAVDAIDDLRYYGWLHLLKGTDLYRGNLGGADFYNADLSGADLGRVNFQNARLSEANLTGATLRRSDLRGARLRGAILVGADLRDVVFDETTVLPDYSTWTPDSDLFRFTDPDHPNFWQPDPGKTAVYQREEE